MQVLEWIAKYWVQEACVLVQAGCTWLYNKRLKRFMTDNKAMKRAMLALLRSSFYSAYKERVEAGVNSIEDREVIQDIYDQYHALGGNGVIDVFKEELDKLPAFQRKEHEKRDREFSKKQVTWSFIAFWVQLALSVAVMLLKPELGEAVPGMLSTTATLTGAVHLAYFGKAGVENYKKIEQSCTHDHSDDEEAEG